MIRGKGATKEGKLGRAGLPQPGEDEPLHALITGNTPEAVKAAVDKVPIFILLGMCVSIVSAGWLSYLLVIQKSMVHLLLYVDKYAHY